MTPQGSEITRQGQRQAARMLMCFCLLGLAPAVYSQGGAVNQPAGAQSDQDPAVRNDDAPSTNAHKDPRSIKQLAGALKNEDRTVRGTAAMALGETHDPHAVKPLIGALKDSDPYVRAFADSALIEIGPPAVEPLIAVLKDSDPYIPALSAMALSAIKDQRAKSALMNALREHNTRVIFGIHTFFVKLGVPGSEGALIETLNKFPNRKMAEEFIKSGNPALADAANAWAAKYHQKIDKTPSATSTRWGSAQDIPPTDANPTPAPAPQ